MKHAKAQLKAQKLSNAVMNDVMEEMEIMRTPICDHDGELHRWVAKQWKEMEKKAMEEGAVDLSGLGFTTSAAMAKQMKDQERRRQETKEKLAAQRKKREEEAKAAAK